MTSLDRRQIGSFLFVLALFGLTACSDPKIVAAGRWVSEQTSAIAIYFYKDGTASVSGTGFLKLEWKEIDETTIRIDVLDKKLVFHFRISKDGKGPYGTLELAGYDTMVFRKK
jgi:hypothetical protein